MRYLISLCSNLAMLEHETVVRFQSEVAGLKAEKAQLQEECFSREAEIERSQRALTICMEKPVIPGWIQMVRVIPVNFFREKGNTFRSITSFPIQPEFVNNLLPGSLGNISEKKWMMANSSDEPLQIQIVYGCDRCFFSSPLLSVFLQHRCSTTGESDLHFNRFHISFPFNPCF